MTEYQDNRHKFSELRQQFPLFCYDRFETQKTEKGLQIQFFFSCGEYRFTPIQIFESKDFYNNTLDENQLNILAFNLGMIELVSYWKLSVLLLFKSIAEILQQNNRTFGKNSSKTVLESLCI